MAFQTGSNVLVAIKAEATTGVIAGSTASEAVRIRLVDSPGLQLDRAVVASNEKRADGLTSMGRLGGKSVSGSFNVELNAGGAVNLMLGAIMRSAFATSTVIVYSTQVVVATNYVQGGTASDWATAGVKVGDIFTISGNAEALVNGINAQVLSITSATLMVPVGTFATSAVADASVTVTRLRKLVNAATPTRSSYSVEQHDTDLDLSEVFLGCRVTGMQLSFKPGEMATAQFTLMGMDRTQLTTATSPYYITPVLTTSLSLVADDGTICKGGVVVAKYTGIDLNFNLTAKGEPVIGSLVSPDIFDNDLSVDGSITGLREDFANLTLYDAETEFELALLLQEPTGAPPVCLSFFFPRVKISALSAPVGGSDGAKIETLGIMVGAKAAATGYDAGIANIGTSAVA